MSIETIRPFLRPIAHLLDDPTVTEVMVNGSSRIFVERDGQLSFVPGVTMPEAHLQVAVRNLARALGDDVSEEQPLLDARLPDGSRVAAALPSVSLDGTALTIRKFHGRRFTMEELVEMGTVTVDALQTMREAIDQRQNILISGGTGTGKTTLLNALAGWFPSTVRVVLIEETAELQLAVDNLLRFEARRAQPGVPPVTVRDLLRAALRHRPDRLLIGEVRGGEAFDLLQALNTGHAGTLSTIHANSAEQALRRFTTCVLESGVVLPHAAICHGIADGIQFVIHLEREAGCRVVTHMIRVRGFNAGSDQYVVERVAGTSHVEPCGALRVDPNGSGPVSAVFGT